MPCARSGCPWTRSRPPLRAAGSRRSCRPGPIEADADVVVVHVLTYSREFALDASLTGLTTWRRRLAEDLAGPWTDPARSTGVKIRTSVVEDDNAAAGLLAAAEREQADLIVIGAHGHGSIYGRLLGATAYKISQRARARARAPVVIVPAEPAT